MKTGRAMAEVETLELIGKALDWAVCMAVNGVDSLCTVDYSIDWAQGGPLIDEYGMTVVCMRTYEEESEQAKRPGQGIWSSKQRDSDTDYGWLSPSPLIAVCRAVVRLKLGDVVSVPAELLN